MKRMKLFIPCSFHTELDTLTKCGAVIKVTQNTFDKMWSQVCRRQGWHILRIIFEKSSPADKTGENWRKLDKSGEKWIKLI